MGYLSCKFEGSRAKKWLLGIIIIIVAKTKASPKVLGEANKKVPAVIDIETCLPV